MPRNHSELYAEIFPGRNLIPNCIFVLNGGAVFHRGRLDGSAQALVIGLAPGQLETVVYRVVFGHAGQRLQGFLAKLGIERSYEVINTFLIAPTARQG